MGKLTEEVFDPSCCDGGACSTSESAQPCGCDSGANWTCSFHKTILEIGIKDDVHYILKYVDLNAEHLNKAVFEKIYKWTKT